MKSDLVNAITPFKHCGLMIVKVGSEIFVTRIDTSPLYIALPAWSDTIGSQGSGVGEDGLGETMGNKSGWGLFLRITWLRQPPGNEMGILHSGNRGRMVSSK